jgi:phospholipid/cholesterol/gamma-HCH transport system permease protein
VISLQHIAGRRSATLFAGGFIMVILQLAKAWRGQPITMPDNNKNSDLTPASLVVRNAGEDTLVILGGDWRIGEKPADRTAISDPLQPGSPTKRISFQTEELGDWDSSLLTLLVEIRRLSDANNIDFDSAGLPPGVRSLIELAFAVKEREGARRTLVRQKPLEKIGKAALELWESTLELVEFTGELMLSIKRLLTRRAVLQPSQVWLCIQEAGVEALPIVGLISFLIGMIFAFVGVMQLANFGAGIYTADLVAVAMLREMAPIMTGIIMAGRTGAAYAAQLGTMKVNEEIDALTTLGINPIDFLVLPKFVALIIMMPFLTLYASALGIAGGAAVALAMLDVSLLQYMLQTNNALSFNTLFGGLFKSIVYGGLVALAGTQQGIACGTSAMAVGLATTKAVVSGIVLIVVSASVLTVIYVNLGI